MIYTIIDAETQKKLTEIRRRIRCLQSGGTLDSLKSLGLNPGNQIGASYLSLKKLAETYETDEKIALLLWNTQKREEQIIACFLLPKKINKEKITQLISDCINTEVAEYVGAVFVSQHSEIAQILKEWSETGQPYLQIAALTAGARHLMLYKQNPLISQETFQVLVNKEYEDKYVQLVAARYRK